MFNKNRKSHFNNSNIKGYIKFIKQLIKDDTIKYEIIREIKRFNEEGIIEIDGNNLRGKILGKTSNLYLDIKYEDGRFVCTYTNWSLNSPVIIEQDELKEQCYRITKTEKDTIYSRNNLNAFKSKLTEKIYNNQGILLYESESNNQEEFIIYNDNLLYRDDSPFKNVFEVEKNWYYPNGSIIKYTMCKNELHTKEKTEESYNICLGSEKTDCGNVFYFEKLPKELFIMIMSGKMTIDKVVEILGKKDNVKSLKNH